MPALVPSITGAQDFSGTPTDGQLARYTASTKRWSGHTLVAGDIPSLSSIYLPLAGGQMSAPITFGGSTNSIGLDNSNTVLTLTANNDIAFAVSGSILMTVVGANDVGPLIQAFAPLDMGGFSVLNCVNLAPLASPTFTGTPAGPTAGGGTNTTQLATTAFVTSAVAGVSGVTSVGLSTPSWLTVVGSPVTSSGTLAVTENAGVGVAGLIGSGMWLGGI